MNQETQQFTIKD